MLSFYYQFNKITLWRSPSIHLMVINELIKIKMIKKRVFAFVFLFVSCLSINSRVFSQQKDLPLRVVFIRHGEKPKKGSNLTCDGFNRSLQLPSVISKKFGIPTNVYVSALGLGEQTKHCRMFETAIPLAVKYNLTLNTKFEEKDASALAADILKQSGTVLVVWEHKAIAPIVQALGVKKDLTWDDDDFDSIWIVTFDKGTAVYTTDKEGIVTSSTCPF